MLFKASSKRKALFITFILMLHPSSAKQNSSRPEHYPLNMTRKVLRLLKYWHYLIKKQISKISTSQGWPKSTSPERKGTSQVFNTKGCCFFREWNCPFSDQQLTSLLFILHKRRELMQIGRSWSSFNRDWNRRKYHWECAGLAKTSAAALWQCAVAVSLQALAITEHRSCPGSRLSPLHRDRSRRLPSQCSISLPATAVAPRLRDRAQPDTKPLLCCPAPRSLCRTLEGWGVSMMTAPSSTASRPPRDNKHIPGCRYLPDIYLSSAGFSHNRFQPTEGG